LTALSKKMVALSVLLIGSGLLQAASSRTVPSRPLVERAQVAAAAPAAPSATLISDFKKGNVSAQWAPGHPKIWGSEEAKFEASSYPGDSYRSGSVSSDEKLVVMANATAIRIVRLDTGVTISNFSGYTGTESIRIVPAASGGEYDVLVSASDYTTRLDTTYRLRLGPDGNQIGDVAAYTGRFSSFDPWPFSKDGRRMLTASWEKGFAYDLDDRVPNIFLGTHTDGLMSSAFSPDGRYISTAAWDQTAKLWDATSGKLVHTFATTGQNWVTRFSPDNKHVLVAVGPGYNISIPSVKIWALSNLTAEPISIGPFHDWVRSVQWSPDSEYVAIGGLSQLQIWSMSKGTIVQNWEMEDKDFSNEFGDVVWVDGSRRLAYRIVGGLEMYDFETNLKYRWGPDDLDRWTGSPVGSTYLVRSKGWIGGLESDGKLRFWAYPA
jgi:WD40 repeat protein